MKKIITLLVLLSTVPAYAYELGGLLGAGFGNASSDIQNTSTNTGLTVGATSEFGIYRRILYVQPELLFIQKGASRESMVGLNGTQVITQTVNARLNYLEVPALVKAKLQTGSVTPYFMTGPSIAFKVGSDVTVESPFGKQSSSIDQAKSVDFSWNLGVGADTKVSRDMKLFMDLRYIIGLTDSIDLGGASYKNRTWLLGAGLRFLM